MINEKFPGWFKDFQKIEKEKVYDLSENENYGKGISGCDINYSFEAKGVVGYRVKKIDKNIELYTLNEAFEVDNITFLLKNLFTSELMPKSNIKLDSLTWSEARSGLVAYIQPQISESGFLEEQHLELESELFTGTSFDIFVVIVKTGAKLVLSNEYIGRAEESFLGRKFIIVCEDGASVIVNDCYTAKNKCNIFQDSILFLSANSNINYFDTIKSEIILKNKKQAFLIGEGASASVETVGKASRDSVLDIANSINVFSPMCNATINSAFLVKDKSHLIYRSGIISQFDSNDFIDESKILFVGQNSRVDELPIKGSSNKRLITKSYLDEVGVDDINKFFNRILDSDKIKILLN